MGNQPESAVDPNGLAVTTAGDDITIYTGDEMLAWWNDNVIRSESSNEDGGIGKAREALELMRALQRMINAMMSFSPDGGIGTGGGSGFLIRMYERVFNDYIRNSIIVGIGQAAGNDPGQDGGKDKKEKDKEYVTPDFDGRPPSREEANLHYLYGKGEPLYVNLSKVDLSFLTPIDFDETEGRSKAIQTLWSSDDGRVFGNITLTWVGGTKVTSTYGFDKYDFEMHGWGNPKNWVRNAATIYGDPGKGTPFMIYFRGEGVISPLPTWRQKAYEMINQGIKLFTPKIPGR